MDHKPLNSRHRPPNIPQTKANIVERILTREQEVQQARKAAEEKLAEAKDLESQWQAKQAEMDAALKVATCGHWPRRPLHGFADY